MNCWPWEREQEEMGPRMKHGLGSRGRKEGIGLNRRQRRNRRGRRAAERRGGYSGRRRRRLGFVALTKEWVDQCEHGRMAKEGFQAPRDKEGNLRSRRDTSSPPILAASSVIGLGG